MDILSAAAPWYVLFHRSPGTSKTKVTQLHLLQTPPPDPAYTKLPIKNAIALDPWLDPIPMPSSSTSGHPSMPPILVINSQSFTNWSTHFNRLVKLCKEAKAGLMTLFGSDRESDFPALYEYER